MWFQHYCSNFQAKIWNVNRSELAPSLLTCGWGWGYLGTPAFYPLHRKERELCTSQRLEYLNISLQTDPRPTRWK